MVDRTIGNSELILVEASFVSFANWALHFMAAQAFAATLAAGNFSSSSGVPNARGFVVLIAFGIETALFALVGAFASMVPFQALVVPSYGIKSFEIHYLLHHGVDNLTT
jgi:hypothetical protein